MWARGAEHLWQSGRPLWVSPPHRAQTVWSGALTLLLGKTSPSHKDKGILESKGGAPLLSHILTELGPALALHDSQGPTVSHTVPLTWQVFTSKLKGERKGG